MPEIDELCDEVGTSVAGWVKGVGGPDDDGDTGSVTHMRWLLVATSFATVWARVLSGVTWKTGNESLPSCIPRVDKMTLMKWMQVLRRRGSDDDFVRSLTSTVDIFPITLLPLSTMAKDDIPSSMRRVRASIKGLSPLEHKISSRADVLLRSKVSDRVDSIMPNISSEHDLILGGRRSGSPTL